VPSSLQNVIVRFYSSGSSVEALERGCWSSGHTVQRLGFQLTSLRLRDSRGCWCHPRGAQKASHCYGKWISLCIYMCATTVRRWEAFI